MTTVVRPASENPRLRIRSLMQLLIERQQWAQEFLDAREHTASPSEQIAYALDARLVLNPDAAPTDVIAKQRRAALLRAVQVQGGRWKSGRAVRLYEQLGYGVVSPSAASHDLLSLAKAGCLKRHVEKGVTYYKGCPQTRKRPRVNHVATAARLRANPGVWLPVGEYRSAVSADSTARQIRNGYDHHPGRPPSPYVPSGAFESRMEQTEFGVQITARYVGEEAERV